jgi:hypothetical protein
MPDHFYAVSPGQGEPKRYDGTLAGVCEAMSEAKFWSIAGPAQEVSVTRDGASRRLFEYRGGRETFRSCAHLVPPPADDPVVTDLAARRSQPRRRRREKASWPGLDLNSPPCAGTD